MNIKQPMKVHLQQFTKQFACSQKSNFRSGILSAIISGLLQQHNNPGNQLRRGNHLRDVIPKVPSSPLCSRTWLQHPSNCKTSFSLKTQHPVILSKWRNPCRTAGERGGKHNTTESLISSNPWGFICNSLPSSLHAPREAIFGQAF